MLMKVECKQGEHKLIDFVNFQGNVHKQSILHFLKNHIMIYTNQKTFFFYNLEEKKSIKTEYKINFLNTPLTTGT
jgi:hypothetical protein